MPTYICLSLRRFLTGGFCLEGFVRDGFCPSPLNRNCNRNLQTSKAPLMLEYIHCNRKLNITFNFRFHVYEFFLKCDVKCSWALPLSQTVTPGLPDPLECDVLYGQPLTPFHGKDGPLGGGALMFIKWICSSRKWCFLKWCFWKTIINILKTF